MDKIPKLGNVREGDDGFRDAVHIAVAPVFASEDLEPGDRIGFTGEAYQVGKNAPIIGIVDPFIRITVLEGEKFYMFLMPNTITSLRHDWTHPAFAEEDELAEAQKTFHKIQGTPESEKWVKDYAEGIDTTYQELMDAAKNYIDYGEYFTEGGKFEGVWLPDEFWVHYEKITRKKVDEENKHSFFSCSC